MDMELFVVGAIVLVAVGYLVRRALRKGDCGSGCGCHCQQARPLGRLDTEGSPCCGKGTPSRDT